MIKYISRDEWWPMFDIDDSGMEPYDQPIDIPEDKITWIKESTERFWETQTYLREQYETRRKKKDG